MGDGKGNVKSGLAISLGVTLLNWAAGGFSFVNPDWVGSIQKLLGQIPYIGPYILLAPLEPFTLVLSILAIWGFLTIVLNRILGIKNLLICFVAGVVVLILVCGMNVFDIWKAIVENYQKFKPAST